MSDICCLTSYSEDEGGHGCKEISVDQSQSSRELAFSSSSVEQPTWKNNNSAVSVL